MAQQHGLERQVAQLRERMAEVDRLIIALENEAGILRRKPQRRCESWMSGCQIRQAAVASLAS